MILHALENTKLSSNYKVGKVLRKKKNSLKDLNFVYKFPFLTFYLGYLRYVSARNSSQDNILFVLKRIFQFLD